MSYEVFAVGFKPVEEIGTKNMPECASHLKTKASIVSLLGLLFF